MKSQGYVPGTRSKLTALLVGVVLVGVIAMLLVVGFTVLIALTAIGTLLGLATIARRAMRRTFEDALIIVRASLVIDRGVRLPREVTRTPYRSLPDRPRRPGSQ